MDIVMKNPADLIPYGNNPRKNDAAVDSVANSIREFGFKVPIVVDADGVIVAGHTRLKAAEKLGLKEVPVIVADDLTEEQVKAFRIADNKTNDLAGWDNERLKEELNEIFDFDMTDFGFGEFELTILKEDMEPEVFDKELMERYSGDEDRYTLKKRVIITFFPDDEERVAEMLGLPAIKKVTYDLSELA